MKKTHSAAVDGHQTTKRHTTTNRSTVPMMGGVCVTRCDRGRTCGEALSRRLRRELRRQKI